MPEVITTAGKSTFDWFSILILIVAAVIVGLTIANILYFNRIRQGGTVQPSEASSMVWLNVIVMIGAVIVFLIALWVLFSHKEIVCSIATGTKVAAVTPAVVPAAPVTVSKTVTQTTYTPPVQSRVSTSLSDIATGPRERVVRQQTSSLQSANF
jgi:hypothetical protein